MPHRRKKPRHKPAPQSTPQTPAPAPVSYERFGYDYTFGLTRAVLADACLEETTPPAPATARALLLATPETQSGQAAARPDTS